MTPLACVIIPIYKNTFSLYEEISLQQCMRILAKHPIIIVKPKSLNINGLKEKYPQIFIESFDDSFFSSVYAYNILMLSPIFYERFLAYEFSLIYQLDAFVFKDELNYWCQQNYDYIGAPWRIEIDFDSKIKEWLWQLKKKTALWLQLKENRYGVYGPMEIIRKRSVGNGGFSLRRNQKFIDLLLNNPQQVQRYKERCEDNPAYNEDMFFGIEMNRYLPKLRIPNWKIALRFAVEHLPRKALKINNTLPFGCHAWDIYETDFWKIEIEKFGYKI